ncbi:hypothetical protein KBB96_05030 [Luteolibacter ambystomatis]|uniref:Uncharacterized protein n=1 Tax=Luteolibacter ambystomatis TaxID=2824561 RepID=A0A975PGH5_9BACT|nr:hypothetical protein [Luteolibacter ambystomatis]QUE52256.1 hypothetical protein KBB96_05030 [Luteolibacter ambystomatis]
MTIATEKPEEENLPLSKLKSLCWTHFRELGFDCMAACFDEVAPKTDGELTLAGWSSAEFNAPPWTFRVRFRPFHISHWSAHLEVRHDGPLPGVTETGYRSMFVPLKTFATMTPKEFVRSEICSKLPATQQLNLF